MKKSEFLRKVEELIKKMPKWVDKDELIKKVIELLLSENITSNDCLNVKKLLKENFTKNASIEEQERIQNEIEMLCNNV